MTTSAAAVVNIEQLGKQFGARAAVSGLSFTMAPGEVVALLGPNGAGKTTTLRMLAGLIAPSSGRGTVAGTPLGGADAETLRASVGLLTEMPGLWDRLTVAMNLVTYARLHGLSDPGARVREVIATFGLEGREHDVAAVLSKGLRQRVALARAVLHAPRLLLLDEPTSGLDPEAAGAVRRLIRTVRADGTAVLVCTHNLSEAELLADRIGVLSTTLRALDTLEGLRRRFAAAPRVSIDVAGDAVAWVPVARERCAGVTSAASRLSCALTSPDDVPELVRALVSAGARVQAVVPEAPSLEAAYLALVHGDD